MSVRHPTSYGSSHRDDTNFSNQFLNSVLSTIGGDGQQVQSPTTQLRLGSKPQIHNPVHNADANPRPSIPQPDLAAPGRKRKAEDVHPVPTAKVFKVEQRQGQTNGILSSSETSSSRDITRPTISTSKSALAVPYRGTSRPSPTSTSPNTPNTDASKAAPKKGSYAEIMARASANNKPSVGVIKHKPKETISAKKEILMRKKGILPKGKGEHKEARDGSHGRDKDSILPSSSNPKSSAMPGKKPLQPNYKGTAALKPQPAYKGTMKPRSSIADTARRKNSRDDRSRSNSTNPHRRGKDYESEEDDDDIDEQDFYSDESDGMEAGFSDVEEEETAAMRAARKEDEEQLKIENQLKKEKEDRKKKLAAMAAKAPKPRY
ncbi:MAG: hypothetical protein LQ343_000019 [Gyalolechia ehrenbergii]|nr:MAG: hypothetical protein LQ343_000019 [Gyalolechia ehrenbergii]